MSRFAVGAVLLDIEGTTSSVRYVYDVMFPYVRRRLAGWLDAHWAGPSCRSAVTQIARDTGQASLTDWAGDDPDDQRRAVEEEVLRLMDGDVKATGLKQLQGLIWEDGFESGELQAHLFDDVPPALLRWNAEGLDVRIYSSGSVQAQQLFFGHTEYGDLLRQFRGHYDTTTGPKKEAASYAAIAADIGLPPGEILFLSDIPAELDAAAGAGLQTCLCLRPDNAEVDDCRHPAVSSFAQLEIV